MVEQDFKQDFKTWWEAALGILFVMLIIFLVGYFMFQVLPGLLQNAGPSPEVFNRLSTWQIA